MTHASGCLASALPLPASPPTARIIQGGMGSGVSGWRLARAVSQLGGLGVVSGSGLDGILSRRLQDGDADGNLRRALAAFPVPGIAEQVLARWHRPQGREPGEPYRLPSLGGLTYSRARQDLIVVASFVEVWLAKEGHDRPVGFNLLTKIQAPTLLALHGAMLAGVDVVLMGAGIPREIPGALDALATGERATLRLEVQGLRADEAPHVAHDPRSIMGETPAGLRRPAFLPIIASNLLATVLARKSTGRVDGFIVEGPTAGGHNAPPRGESALNARGEPVYGERDVVDLARLSALGLPFWLAGGMGSPEGLRQALAAGAAGIQVGTLFAYCEEAGTAPGHALSVVNLALQGRVDVLTDPRASPTGFPFKVVSLPGTLSDGAVHAARERVCDLGYLRAAYRRDDGRVGFRCPAEPVAAYVAKGGDEAETAGRRCLCNALLATIGLAQVRADGRLEPSVLTAGDDLSRLGAFLGGRTAYSAADVLDYLLD